MGAASLTGESFSERSMLQAQRPAWYDSLPIVYRGNRNHAAYEARQASEQRPGIAQWQGSLGGL